MSKECKILSQCYKKLFLETMNPVFFTLASYIENNNIAILLGEKTNEKELTL